MSRQRPLHAPWSYLLVPLTLLALVSVAGRWFVPAPLYQRLLAHRYGIPPALSFPSGLVQELASRTGVPLGEVQKLEIPLGATRSNSGGRLFFPQMGDGNWPQVHRSIQTSLLLLNDSQYDAQLELDFYSDAGQPLAVTISGVKSSHFSSELKAGHSARFVTSGTGSLTSGWVEVTSDQPLAGNSAFTLRDDEGQIRTDVGVGESLSGTSFTIFADTKGVANTGLALVNPDSSQTIQIDLALRDVGGVTRATRQLTLGPRQHWAQYLTEIFQGVTGIGDFEGSVSITSSQKFAGITLRSAGDLLTSVPMAATPDEDSTVTEMVFPHIADGDAGSLRITSSVLLINNTATSCSGTVDFFQSDGSAMPVQISGRTDSSFAFQLAPGAVQRLTTQGAGAVKTGWASVTMDHEISGAAIFAISGASGELLSEVGVASSVPLPTLNLFADSTGPARTGMAITNPTEEDSSATLVLYDSAGNLVAQKDIVVGAHTHQSSFVDEEFPSVAGIDEFDGSLRIFADEPLSAISLRQVNALTTSLPILLPLHGFAPVSVVDLVENLTSTAPAMRWRLSQSGFDLSMESARLSASDLGVDLDSVAPSNQLGYGFLAASIQGAQLAGGIVELTLTGRNPNTFEGRVFSSALGDRSGDALISGTLEGNPNGGFSLEVNPADLGLGTWNQGMDFDLDLFFPPGFIVTPSQAKTVNIETRLVSVSSKVYETGVPITSTITQPTPVTAPASGAPQLFSGVPLLLVPGQKLTLFGSGFGAEPSVIFSLPEGGELEAVPLEVRADALDVVVPWGLVDGPLWVENGTKRSNPLFAKLLFAPETEVTAGPQSSQGYPLTLTVRQGPMQLATASFEATLFNTGRSLSGLGIGSRVGAIHLTMGGVPTLDLTLKVAESGANRAVFEALDEDDDVFATITVEPTSGSVPGLTFTYAPAQPLESATVNTFSYQMDVVLDQFPIPIGVGGDPGLSWVCYLFSTPPGAGDSTSAFRVVESL